MSQITVNPSTNSDDSDQDIQWTRSPGIHFLDLLLMSCAIFWLRQKHCRLSQVYKKILLADSVHVASVKFM